MPAHPVELRGVSTRFGQTWVHRRIDLAVPAGEVVALAFIGVALLRWAPVFM